MIYLPNPYFIFEKSNGGGIAGMVLLEGESEMRETFKGCDFLEQAVSELWRVNIQDVILKFDKARSSYWEGRHYKAPDTTYCFLREDGAEFAVRFIKANGLRWDVVGYWAGIDSWETAKSPITEFKDWLEAQCPSVSAN